MSHPVDSPRRQFGKAPGQRMLRGLPLSPGIAAGKAFVLPPGPFVPHAARKLSDDELGTEITRFDAAMQQAEREIEVLQRSLRTGTAAGAELLGVQALVLRDPVFIDETHKLIQEKRIGAESAVSHTLTECWQRFAEAKSRHIVRGARDVVDVLQRLVRILSGQGDASGDVPAESVVVVRELAPSLVAALRLRGARGMVVEHVGATSHAALLARSSGIPCVGEIAGAIAELRSGDFLIVDALAGRVFVNPSPMLVDKYRQLASDFVAAEARTTDRVHLPVQTSDGKTVEVLANVGSMADVETALLSGADGVGLYRTEFEFLMHRQCPGEDEQLRFMKAVAARFHPRPVFVRVLDLGSDKTLPYLQLPPAKNPALAERGIRVLLRYRDIFRIQLSAILRLSASHPASVLLPMVGSVDDIVESRRVLEEAKMSLASDGTSFDQRLMVGAMIETPGAAMIASTLARHVDFLSLGTNDLIQYALASDRESPSARDDCFHPGVLRLIAEVAQSMQQMGVTLSICGEMASDPRCAALLLGLGLRTLSVAPGELLAIRAAIQHVSLERARRVAERALELETSRDVLQYLSNDASTSLLSSLALPSPPGGSAAGG